SEALTGLTSGGNGQGRRCEHDEVVVRSPGRRHGAQRARMPIGHLWNGQWAADERHSLMTLLDQMRDGDLAASDVVEADAAPVRHVAGATVDEHDRQATRRQRVQQRSALVDGRDEYAVDALLKQ